MNIKSICASDNFPTIGGVSLQHGNRPFKFSNGKLTEITKHENLIDTSNAPSLQEVINFCKPKGIIVKHYKIGASKPVIYK